jgi:hypothetical protein
MSTAFGEGLRPESPYGASSGLAAPQPSPAPACPNADKPRPAWLWHGYCCPLDKELHRYPGITCRDYWAMLEHQGGVCAVCHEPPGHWRLVVDRDHDTNELLGLIHARHNRGITTKIRRYVQDPPARALGLVADPAAVRRIERRRQKQRRAAKARQEAAKDAPVEPPADDFGDRVAKALEQTSKERDP